MNILSLLDGNGYVKLNKCLAHYLGTSVAIFLAEIISEHEYWKRMNRLTADGYFYSTIENVWAETTLKKDTQLKCIDLLEQLGVLHTQRLGPKRIRHFKLNEEALTHLLTKAQKYFEQEQISRSRTGRRYDIGNSDVENSNSEIGKTELEPLNQIGKTELDQFGKTDPNNNNINKNNNKIRIYTQPEVTSIKNSQNSNLDISNESLSNEQMTKMGKPVGVAALVPERMAIIDSNIARENKQKAIEREAKKQNSAKQKIRMNKINARLQLAEERTSNKEVLSWLESYILNNEEVYGYIFPDRAWRIQLDKFFGNNLTDNQVIDIIKTNIEGCYRKVAISKQPRANTFDNTHDHITPKGVHDMSQEELTNFTKTELARDNDGNLITF